MERKILFCNIAWMKYYSGINDDDRPYNGGEYIKRTGSATEAYNFTDGNGKCYGYVRSGGDMSLQNHYKGVRSSDSFVDDVLVVWVATNEEKQTRIVGWYKNARIYRTYKYEPTFTNSEEFNLFYNIEVDAIDAYLLPEGKRTFPIDRANEVGMGKGFGQSNIWYAESEYARNAIVPEVIKYIENYDDEYDNFVYIDELIQSRIEEIEFLDDYEKLFDQAMKYYDEGNRYEAMIYFKAAQRIKEPTELLVKLSEVLYFNARYDEAITLFDQVISIEGESINSLIYLMNCYDLKRDRDKTIEYARRAIDLPSKSGDILQEKIFANYVIFNIHIYKKEFKKAEKRINKFKEFLKDTANYSKDDIDKEINPMRNFLKENIKNLVK